MTDEQIAATLAEVGAEWLMDEQDEHGQPHAIRHLVAVAEDATEKTKAGKPPLNHRQGAQIITPSGAVFIVKKETKDFALLEYQDRRYAYLEKLMNNMQELIDMGYHVFSAAFDQVIIKKTPPDQI